jgi:membrane peptidoglycan carboxypeptidase
VVASVLGGGLLLLVVLIGVGYALTSVPAPSAASTASASRIVYADGTTEIGRIGRSNRVLVPLTAVSDPMRKAVLAAEDRGYYSEPGVSVTGIGRAVVAAVTGGQRQGGSTITQQYAKNAYLSSQQTYTRKVKEAFIAVKLTRTRSKDQVLGDYLNTVYFGRGADGVQVAARTFFAKDAKDLTAPEAAVLAAMLRSPSGYDPARHPQAARARWDYVLDGMVAQGWLSAETRRSAVYPTVQPVGAGPAGGVNDRSGPKGYVMDRVEEELSRHGLGEAQLAAGGLVVRTTLQARDQKAAVDAVGAAVPPARSNADPVAALVSIRPGTGEVDAYVGGTAGNGGTDYASAQLRQPGSSFKPFALATALEKGTSLKQTYNGASPQKICGQDVTNDQGDPPLQQVDLVRATALSVNTVYYRLACDTGPQKIADLAHRAGIPDGVRLSDPNGPPTAGIALGQYEVHVVDQAAAFATLAAQGTAAQPFFVAEVKRDGAQVYAAKRATSRAFDPRVAADTTVALQEVVRSGTGTRAQLQNRPTAGKTGTTSANKDAWFCGFVPQLATAVWVGRPDDAPLTNVLGSGGAGVYGGTVPAGIFKRYMDAALQGVPVQPFPPAANLGSAAPSASASSTPSTSPTPSPTPTPSASPASSAPVPPPSPTPAVTSQQPTPSTAPSRTRSPSPTPSPS